MNTPLFVASAPLIAIGVVVGVVGLIILFVAGQYISLWAQAFRAGAPVQLAHLIMMRLRKVDPKTIVSNRISARKAGLDISSDALESHDLAGGRVTNVVRAMIAADKARIDLPWERATAIDLAGRDILEAVRTSVESRVIGCPNAKISANDTIDAMTMDGILLRAKARITVRTNIERLVGGAPEETLIASVGEGIASVISSAHSHKAVLKNPDKVARAVLAKGLDSRTALQILSIDIDIHDSQTRPHYA